jgi:hypothetical protein
MEIIGKFESGDNKPFANVSGHERLSIGFLQWNWDTRSIFNDFFPAVSAGDIALAAPEIREDLLQIKNYSNDQGNATKKAAAENVLNDWTTEKPGDVLSHSVRTTVYSKLSSWLDSDPIRKRQLQIIDGSLKLAYAYSTKWRDAQSGGGDTQPVDARLLASFFDLIVFNGGRQGIWYPQVKSFRATYKTNKEIINVVTDWLKACDKASFPHFKHSRMYNRQDGVKSAVYWSGLISEADDAFDSYHIDLFIFGFLRALQSNGDNKPNGFKGIYQADVMTRRGVIALGSGYIRGTFMRPFAP